MRIFFTFTVLLLFLTYHPARSQTGPPPAKEQVLLLEDFKGDPKALLPNINHGDTAFAKIENGQYLLDSRKAARFWALRLGIPEGLSAKPTIMEMKMKVWTDSLRSEYGILWHTVQKTKNSFDEYAFLVSTQGFFIVTVKVEGKPYYLKDWTPCSCVVRNGYNILRFEQGDGNNFRFFINGTLVYESPLVNADLTTMGFYSDAHTVLAIDYIKLAVQETGK